MTTSHTTAFICRLTRAHNDQIETHHLCVGDDGLTAEKVERVALNFITNAHALHRAPEDEGDNVFMSDPDPQWADYFYWVTEVVPVDPGDVETLKKYLPSVPYEVLLQDGEIEIL